MKLFALAFAGALPLVAMQCSQEQQDLAAGLGTLLVVDVCKVSANQWSKVGNPTLAQSLAYEAVSTPCADPAALAQLGTRALVGLYNNFAAKTGSPKATVTASGAAAMPRSSVILVSQ